MTDHTPDLPPQPPELDRSTVDALVEYAEAQAAFWRRQIDLGTAPPPQGVTNTEGWTFVAEALAESYDD